MHDTPQRKLSFTSVYIDELVGECCGVIARQRLHTNLLYDAVGLPLDLTMGSDTRLHPSRIMQTSIVDIVRPCIQEQYILPHGGGQSFKISMVQ